MYIKTDSYLAYKHLFSFQYTVIRLSFDSYIHCRIHVPIRNQPKMRRSEAMKIRQPERRRYRYGENSIPRGKMQYIFKNLSERHPIINRPKINRIQWVDSRSRLIFCVLPIGNISPTIAKFAENRMNSLTLSATTTFQPVSFSFSFVGGTAESDEVENRRRWGTGKLKKRWPVCEEGDFGIIRRKS